MYNPANGHMCFAEALAYLKRQQPIARASWPTGHHLLLKYGNTLAYSSPTGHGPWTPSSSDVLAEDWVFHLPASTH